VLGKPFSARDVFHLTQDGHSGDKSNHIPSFHVPQLYYFVGFASLMGWPVLAGYPGGPSALLKDIYWRMFGTQLYVPVSSSGHPLYLTISKARPSDRRALRRDGGHCPSVHVRPFKERTLLKARLTRGMPPAYTTPSCSRITGTTPSTSGGAYSCCTRPCRTSSFRGISPVPGRGFCVSVRVPRCATAGRCLTSPLLIGEQGESSRCCRP
jgi:hypothetical protein